MAARVSHKSMVVGDVDHVPGIRDPRCLAYLERRANSDNLVVLLHGMGLDGSDFADFLERHEVHAVAPTLVGFEADAERLSVLNPIHLDDHVRILTQFIRGLQQSYPDKRLILVGFSLGADMLLRLAEYWQGDQARMPAVHAALLLDPNVNHSTMSISKIFAEADPAVPHIAMLKAVQLASNVTELRNICGYIYRIAYKDFWQIKQHARDFCNYWPSSGEFHTIAVRLQLLSSLVEVMRVVTSATYEPHVSAIQSQTSFAQVTNTNFEVTKLDHFDLINHELLAAELATLEADGSPSAAGRSPAGAAHRR